MSKKKKHNLSIDEEETFDLVGISSHHQDYRLAWNLNEVLDIHLERADENFEVYSKKGAHLSSHPYFYFKDDENLITFYLIKNKYEGKFLIPEKPMIDYFLCILENYLWELKEICEKIKRGSSVLGVFPFEIDELKSSENLVFEL